MNNNYLQVQSYTDCQYRSGLPLTRLDRRISGCCSCFCCCCCCCSSSSVSSLTILGLNICLNCDTLRVLTCPFSFRAVTLECDLFVTTYGYWLKLVDSLLCLSC